MEQIVKSFAVLMKIQQIIFATKLLEIKLALQIIMAQIVQNFVLHITKLQIISVTK